MTKVKEAPTMPAPAIGVSFDQLAAHNEERARRQAAMDANREEMILCTNSQYAARREMEKPHYIWTVEVDRYDAKRKGGPVCVNDKLNVVAQNENDAWARYCDRREQWHNPRDVKIKFTRGKQLTQTQVAAQAESVVPTEIPRVKFKPKDEEVQDWEVA